ncbi:MAG TPA: esterase [Mycobacterium sp.]|nr:esterase [Mycobacterium sp.]
MALTRYSVPVIAAAATVLVAGCSSSPSPDTLAATTDVSTTRISTPTGQFVVQGAIMQKFNESGGSNGPLGMPIANEQSGPDGGRYSKFQLGVIYWTPRTGAHIVWGDIRTAWETNGGASGPLGYPSSDEQPVPGGWKADFEHGVITLVDGHVDVQTH